jgi:hypothetical protein
MRTERGMTHQNRSRLTNNCGEFSKYSWRTAAFAESQKVRQTSENHLPWKRLNNLTVEHARQPVITRFHHDELSFLILGSNLVQTSSVEQS